ncbi:MAG: DUF3131 domain-containing protein [Sulfitobacter sp.]
MDRRTFMKWGVAAPLMLGPLQGLANTRVPQNTIVVLDGVGPDTDAERLAIVLNAFAKQGLPASCLIEGQPQRRLTPDHPVSQLLREHRKKLPGLFEVLPVVPDLGLLTPYFQARAVYQAQIDLFTSIWGDDSTDMGVFNPQSIACDIVERPLAPSGVRASGIRNVLMRPSATTPVRPEAWDDGVLRMIGGKRVQLSVTKVTVVGSDASRVERVFYLSASEISETALPRLEAAASQFAVGIQVQDGANWSSTILASDIQFRDAYGYRRNMGLHFFLEAEASEDDRAILADFRLDLIKAGVPSSFGAPVGSRTNAPTGIGYWVDVQGMTGADSPLHPLEVYGGSIQRQTPKPTPGAYGMGVQLSDLDNLGNAGVDPENTIHVPTFRVHDAASVTLLGEGAFGTDDFVVLVTASALRRRTQRSLMKNALLGLADDGITAAMTLPNYVRSVVPTGAYISHFRRTVTYASAAKPDRAAPDAKALEQYLADAKTAWGYFERWTDKKTGLCPATVNFSPGNEELHQAVTMWDVGSHINALIAAYDLKLVTKAQFQQAIKKILPNIAGRTSQGRLLPQGWIATDRFKWGTKDFDGCDAGRLMAALYNLDSHPAAKDKAAKTVAAWDLRDVVIDGIIYSVQQGKLETTFRSHCSHYAAWAFRTWGIEVRSPYEVFDGVSTADGKMALLEVGGHIGPMGAEPLLLEAIELGMSAESAYLADVLFAAQLEEYDDTGRLTCVSEGPIDRAPWFTYQGIQFDAPGRVWATDTVAGLDEHRSPEFRAKNAVISSKGAYLWAAYKDHSYCDMLVEYVREKARTSNGFSSSIYQSTGKATSTYADINTNAIILQSIAQIMKNAGGV